jgi:hypothetical protein
LRVPAPGGEFVWWSLEFFGGRPRAGCSSAYMRI